MRLEPLNFLLLVVSLAFVGCEESAGQRVPVAGLVRIDGRPVTEGTMQFVPKSGRPISCKIHPDGKFELISESAHRVPERGALPGEYRVQVSAAKIVSDQVIEWKVPQRYADFRTSGLQVLIDKPQDDLLIDLTWKGGETGNQNADSAKLTPSTEPAAKVATP